MLGKKNPTSSQVHHGCCGYCGYYSGIVATVATVAIVAIVATVAIVSIVSSFTTMYGRYYTLAYPGLRVEPSSYSRVIRSKVPSTSSPTCHFPIETNPWKR